MKVALIYDRVNKWGGAERVLLALHELFPEAPLYTAVYDPVKAPWAKVFPRIIPSFLQKIPILNKKHEFLGSFVPLAFESFDFSQYDLVISVTSEAAKGIIAKPGTFHLCYLLTPTRYLWSGYEEYQKRPGILGKIPFYNFFSLPFLNYVKFWDKIACQRPDIIITISNEVKKRVACYYHREADLIFPPCGFKKKVGKTQKKNYYLVVNRLVPYKKVDLVVKAFNKIDKKLVVVGSGSEEKKLKSLAAKNIKFVGEISEEKLINYYLQAKALIMPQEEDFGIVSVEAQSLGLPVIAFKKGGALDTVVDGRTGVFFNEQTEECLVKTIKKFDKMHFKEQDLIDNAKKFSKTIFQKKFMSIIEK